MFGASDSLCTYELRSMSLARGLQDVHNIPPRLTLSQVVCQMVHNSDVTGENASRLAAAYLDAGREPYGYLQAAFRDSDVDRSILPSCLGSGYEAW